MCKYYHAENGGWCFIVSCYVSKLNGTVPQQKDYIRPASCNGNKECCDFKKFGLKVEVQK